MHLNPTQIPSEFWCLSVNHIYISHIYINHISYLSVRKFLASILWFSSQVTFRWKVHTKNTLWKQSDLHLHFEKSFGKPSLHVLFYHIKTRFCKKLFESFVCPKSRVIRYSSVFIELNIRYSDVWKRYLLLPCNAAIFFVCHRSLRCNIFFETY